MKTNFWGSLLGGFVLLFSVSIPAGAQSTPSTVEETSPPEPTTETKSYLRPSQTATKSAAPAETSKSLTSRSDPNLGRVSLALLLVLGLGVVALYAKRRGKAPGSLRNQVRLHTLSSLSLGPKSKVALVSVGREALLLGVSEGEISCLRCYPEDELWSLTSALPGFGDLIREQEEQAKLAQRPISERSVMDRGMNHAFSELLTKAGHPSTSEESKSRSSPGAKAPSPLAPDSREDEFVPSQVKTGTLGRNLASKSGLEEFPPHLVALLAETQGTSATQHTPSKPNSTNVVRFPAAQSETFGAADGQAAELARRFSEFGS